MKVWPAQLVLVKPKPVGVTVVFCAVELSGFASTTLPGLAVRSQLAGTPRWKAVCVLSVKQPLCAAAERVKFCVGVPPSGTAIVAADARVEARLVGGSDGYVPAGTVNE